MKKRSRRLLIKIIRYWEAKGKAVEVSDHGREGGTFIGCFLVFLGNPTVKAKLTRI